LFVFGRGEVNRQQALRRISARPIYAAAYPEAAMQTRNKILDDLSQLMTKASNAMKSMLDRWLADRDFVTREEFDAVRAMAQKAREENAALAARLDALEGEKKPAAKKK
jgi:BMFP domain-containing protein YqiC